MDELDIIPTNPQVINILKDITDVVSRNKEATISELLIAMSDFLGYMHSKDEQRGEFFLKRYNLCVEAYKLLNKKRENK